LISLLYGLSGLSELRPIAAALRGKGLDPLLAVGHGHDSHRLRIQIAAVPFHLWAPDATKARQLQRGVIASGSKVASFFILAKIMMVGFARGRSGAWRASCRVGAVLAVIAAFSMCVGQSGRLAQGNVKRLLAYRRSPRRLRYARRPH